MKISSRKLAILAVVGSFLCVLLVFLMALAMAAAGISGAMSARHFEYAVSYEVLDIIWYVIVFVFGPLSILSVIVSIINLIKWRGRALSWVVLGVFMAAMLWFILTNFALVRHEVPDPPMPIHQTDGKLQIRTMNLN